MTIPTKIYYDPANKTLRDSAGTEITDANLFPSATFGNKMWFNLQLVSDGSNTAYTELPTGSTAEILVDNDYNNPSPILPVPAGNANWTAGTGSEYYYNGTDILTAPTSVYLDTTEAAAGTKGALTAGQYAWDSANLRLYVRLGDSTDPDTKAAGYVTFKETAASATNPFIEVDGSTFNQADSWYDSGVMRTPVIADGEISFYVTANTLQFYRRIATSPYVTDTTIQIQLLAPSTAYNYITFEFSFICRNKYLGQGYTLDVTGMSIYTKAEVLALWHSKPNISFSPDGVTGWTGVQGDSEYINISYTGGETSDAIRLPRGITGATGATGADSTVPGPTGATGYGVTGAASTIPGPTGPTGATGYGVTGQNGVGYIPAGEYSSMASYSINDLVTYQGSLYASLVNDNVGAEPGSVLSVEEWLLVVQKGEDGITGATGIGVTGAIGADGLGYVPGYTYDAGVTYDANYIVSYNGSMYVSLQGTNIAKDPATETAYWLKVVSAGVDGEDGATGATGTGITGATGVGVTGATGANGIGYAPMGAWLNSTTYNIDESVTYLGSLYASLQNVNLDKAPASNPTWWLKVVSKGDQGIQGITGATGATPSFLADDFDAADLTGGKLIITHSSGLVKGLPCIVSYEGQTAGEYYNLCLDDTAVIFKDNEIILDLAIRGFTGASGGHYAFGATPGADGADSTVPGPTGPEADQTSTGVTGYASGHTMTSADAGIYIRATGATACTYVFTSGTTAGFTYGAKCSKGEIFQAGAGVVTLEGAADVLLNGVTGGSCDITAQYQGAFWVCTANYAYDIGGSVTEVV